MAARRTGGGALQSDLQTQEIFKLRGVSLPRALTIDHTVAFPRLVWTFLLPMLYFLGYPLPLVVSATLGMYVFYAIIELLSMITCYLLVGKEERKGLRRNWYLWMVMPTYRFMLFWFRFGGFLNALTDEAQWRVNSPWEETAEFLRKVVTRIEELLQIAARRLPSRGRSAKPEHPQVEPGPRSV